MRLVGSDFGIGLISDEDEILIEVGDATGLLKYIPICDEDDDIEDVISVQYENEPMGEEFLIKYREWKEQHEPN